MRWYACRQRRPWSRAAVLVFILGLMTPALAQPNVPADLDLEQQMGLLRDSLQFIPMLGPMMLPMVEGTLRFQQSVLFCHQARADDALRTAWTTHALLDMGKALQQGVAAAHYIDQKLANDIVWYEDEYPRFTNPVYRPETDVEKGNYDKYKALKAFRDEYGGRLLGTGFNVLDEFDELRERIIKAGYAIPSLQRGGGRVAAALLTYCKEMAAIEDAIKKKIYEPRITPLRQVRLRLTNEASDLVFFVRISERDQEGRYPTIRPDTQEWVVIYPKDCAVAIGTPEGDETALTLPNQTWLPAKLHDQLEIRVATMGDTRRRIRFMQIPISGQARPDLQSLSRDFYFFGYEVRQARRTAICHWYSTSETYDWRFTGSWGPVYPEYVTTDINELKEDARYPLSLTRDHVAWRLPAFLETITQNPECYAAVTGTAKFHEKEPRQDSKPEEFSEEGSGTFSIEMEVW